MTALIKSKQLLNTPIISQEEGEKLEDVDDVLYDPQVNKILGFIVRPKGILNGAKIIKYQDVKSIGKDAIIVRNKNVIQKAKNCGERIRGIVESDISISKTKLLTTAGTKLGSISDIVFSLDEGTVEAFIVSRGALEDLKNGEKTVSFSKIVSLSTDAVVIEYPPEDTSKQGQNNKHQPKQQKQEEMKQAKQKKQQQGQQKPKQVVGQYLTVNLLTTKDETIGKRGDLITHALVDKAKKGNLLGKLLNNASKKKVKP